MDYILPAALLVIYTLGVSAVFIYNATSWMDASACSIIAAVAMVLLAERILCR